MAAEQLLDERILRDYGTESPATSEEIRKHVYERPSRDALIDVIVERCIGMICGHVSYETYSDLVPPERVVAFLREPVQRVLSEFHHVQRIYGYKGTLMQYACEPRNRNRQAEMLKGLDLARAALVGLSEYYGHSLGLLAARLDFRLAQFELNINPEKGSFGDYAVSNEEAAEIRELNAEDVQLHCRAVEQFSRATGLLLRPPAGSVEWLRKAAQHVTAPVVPVKGNLGGVRNGQLFGWAMQPGTGEPVWLDVFVNGEPVATIVADRYRRDLQDLGLHPTGCAGFSLQVGELRPGTVIRCRVHGTHQNLWNSPFVVPAAEDCRDS